MIPAREQEAVNAYLKLLQTKGASDEVVQKRKGFLEQLCTQLAASILDGTEYRDVIEIALESIPPIDWHESLNTAREFYPFWVKDIKAIAALSLGTGLDIQSSNWKPSQTSLKTIWDSLEKEKFDISENWPLKAYGQALRHEGAEQSLVETRVKLAKVILIRLREAPNKDQKSYRTAVDLTLPLFSIKENRRLFLVVVREFYHFWSGHPNAASMVLKDGYDNLLP